MACSAATSPSPVPTPTASPPATATAAPVVTMTPVLGGSGAVWLPVRKAPEPGARAWAITSGGPGWVAVGSAPRPADPDRSAPAVWGSADGRAWGRAPDVPSAADGDLTVVAGDGTSLYAAGTIGLTHGVVWRSKDGLSWEAVGGGDQFDLGECFEGCPSLTAVAVGPAGALVAGTSVIHGPQVVGTLWSSTDGDAWQRLSGPLDTGSAKAFVDDAVAGAAGFVVLGHLCDPDCQPGHPATWTSPDGLAWDGPHDLPGGEGVDPIGLAGDDGHFVVLGSRCPLDGPCDMAVWASPDGATWSPAPITGSSVYGHSLAGGLGGFLIIGLSGALGSAWTSADGAAWGQPVSPVVPTFCSPGAISCASLFDLAVGPLGALAVGEVEPAQKGDVAPEPVVWLSPPG